MTWHRRIHQRVRSEMSYVSSQCSQTDEPTSQIMGGRPRVLRVSTSSSMWEFPLPWCQIAARTLSPMNSKLFCLITLSRMYARPRVIISRMVWWNASSKNLRSITNSVMQPARPTFRALLPHFAYIITPPVRLTGLFLIVLCSSMSRKLSCQLNVLRGTSRMPQSPFSCEWSIRNQCQILSQPRSK